MSKATMPSACGYDQRVVTDFAALELHDAIVDIERLHVAQQNVAIWLPCDNRAQWRRDIRRRKPACCNLVQQRLKQMKVAAINKSNLHCRAPQSAGSIQSAESAADDDDAWEVGLGAGG